MAKETKMIRIVSRGYVLSSRGRVMTPIMTPYRESVNRIWSMLTSDRADIEEKLPDGTFVRLNIQNYDKDNTIKADVATSIPHKVSSAPVEEPKVEEPKVEEEVKEEPASESYYSKKNRKRNKNRQNFEVTKEESIEEPEVVEEEPKVDESTSEDLTVEVEEV